MLAIFDSFRRQSNALVGIEISSMSIKLLALSRHGEQYRVDNYGVAPMPADAVIDGDIKDVAAVGAALEQARTRSGVSVRHSATAVPNSSVITKIIQLEAGLKDSEMEDMVAIEASKYIPYPLEEVRLDFTVLGKTEGKANEVDVLLVACRATTVDSLSDALEIGGFKPKIIDVTSYAMERACALIAHQLPGQGRGLHIAVLDIGASTSTFTVLYDLMTVYTREETFGGKILTEEIQRRYGLNYEQAGLAKKQGTSGENHVDILKLFEELLLPHVKRSLQFFYSASGIHEVNYLVLAGGNASIQGVDKLIQEKLNIPTAIANPFAEMSVASNVNASQLYAEAPALMIACGLALRSFD